MTGQDSLTSGESVLADADSSLLGRPVDDQWLIPGRVELHEDELLWLESTGPLRIQMSGPGLLDEFLALGKASRSGFLRFARKWGVLEICHHELPRGHEGWRHWPEPVVRRFWGIGCDFVCWNDDVVREPISIWRQIVRKTRAKLAVAERLWEDEPGRQEDWETIFEDETKLDPPIWTQAVELQRDVLSRFVIRWLRWGGVQLKFGWRVGQPQILLGGEGLFGALAVQVMYAISQQRRYAICSGCGQPFSPKRKPSLARRRFCQACRTTGVPQREATRDYRRRKKEGR